MDEKNAPQNEPAPIENAMATYTKHVDTSLQTPIQKPATKTTVTIDGSAVGQEILNNQEYTFQKPLRTFQGDIADTLKSQNVSIAKISIAEKLKKEKIEKIARSQPQIIAPASPAGKNILLFIISLLLIGGGAYLLYIFYYVPRSQVVVHPSFVVPSIITPDSQKEIRIDPSSTKPFLDTLRAERDAVKLPQNSIAHLYITEVQGTTKMLIGAQKFLSLLKVNAPDPYLRTLLPDFMFGVHSFNGNNPFIILKTNVYQSAFAGMLKWEDTMADDLAPLFSKMSNVPNAPSAPAQSTADILATHKPFVDLVIKNKDVRALTNQYDRIVVLYTFLDKETILITTNEFTLKEILDRMTNRRFVR